MKSRQKFYESNPETFDHLQHDPGLVEIAKMKKQPKNSTTFDFCVLAVCIWLVIAIISAKFNINQGLHPHNWTILKFSTGLLVLVLSPCVGVYFIKKLSSEEGHLIHIPALFICLILFAGAFFYELLLIIDLIK